MRTSVDGSAARAGDRSLHQKLADDGFLLLKGVLRANAVLNVRRDIARVLRERSFIGAGDSLIPALPLHLVGCAEYDQAMASVQSLESFHEIAFDQRLLAVMTAIGCEPVLVHPRKRLRLVPPEHLAPNMMRYAHQDHRYIQGTPRTYTAWIPLGPVPQAMGGLRVLPRSHLRGLFPVSEIGPEKCALMDMPTSGDDWVTADYEPGDVVVFGSLTVHAGGENRSGEFRLSMDCRYQPLAETICSHELDPVRYPSIPHWSVLAGGWSTHRWITVPQVVPVVPFDESLAYRRE